IDYRTFSRALEAKARALEGPKLRVRMVGFAKVVGDLIEGLDQVLGYFAISAAIAALFVFAYTRCLRSTLLLVVSALLGGVCILIFTKLLLVPVALSYVGVSPRAAARSVRGQALEERAARGLWSWLAGFTERPLAGAAVLAAIVLAAGGYAIRTQLRIGDL